MENQKLHRPTTGSQPPAFWDKLSKLWLTRGALRELDRRNSQSASRHPAPSQPSQSASDLLHYCEPATLKAIQRFARRGGPDLSDLTNFPEPIGPPYYRMDLGRKRGQTRGRPRGRPRGRAGGHPRDPTHDRASTKKTHLTMTTKITQSSSPYSRNFQQLLIDNGVYPSGYEYPDGRVPSEPDNLEEIGEILRQARSSSPSQFSQEQFRQFKRADAQISKENKATKMVIPIIEDKIQDNKCIEGDILLTNLTPLVDDTLTTPKPDLYYGSRPEELDRRVRDRLDGDIIPSTQKDLPITPNFFVEAKGPDGSTAVAKRQACYDGAFGARGIHSLQSYGEGKPVYDNKAYTITSIYYGGVGLLQMFTTHLSQPISSTGRPEYYMNQLMSFTLTDTADDFQRGVTAYRNARDWTKMQRDEAIRRANERVNHSQNGAPLNETDTSQNKGSNTNADPPEPGTLTHEFAPDCTHPAKRLKRGGGAERPC